MVLVVVGMLAWLIVPRVLGDEVERSDVASFYEQPANAADGEAGTLIKSEALEGAPVSARAWRIMYRTTDLNGQRVVSTGVVVTPLTPTPDGGRTVLAWGHPTTGTASECAPSKGFDPFLGIEGLRMMLDRGYTVVATDYVGMGTPGPDSYLIGATAGNAVLDSVRAARAIPETHSTSVVLWGHSQGGQAVAFAAQRAHQYAPELTIRAVAAAAPAADLPALMTSHLRDVSGVTIGSYAFQAFSQVYADQGADLSTILTPRAQAALPEMNSLCLLTHITKLHRIAQPLVGHFTTGDPSVVQPWATLLQQNSAGGVKFDAPLFVAQGLDDTMVLPSDTAKFIDVERRTGITVDYHTVDKATHATIAYLALPALWKWLDARHV